MGRNLVMYGGIMSATKTTRRDFLKTAGLTTTGLVLGGCRILRKNRGGGNRPNVIVVLTDDQRWDCLGLHPKPLLGIKTPHLDRLAREGALFENMFVTT